jgi:anti-sigma B factor antagonist
MEGLKFESRNGSLLASYDGELTLEVTRDLKKSVQEKIDETGCKLLAMDLSRVNFIDSSGIGFLVSLASRLKGAGVDFVLYRPSAQVAKTLELVQLKDHFNTVDSERELAEMF